MPPASQQHLEEIRTRLDIVQWIGETVALKRAGRTFKGLCPFHQEKSPSFTVNPERQSFICFGCGEKGDIFTFVMKRENMAFPEALERLARAANITLPVFGSKGKSVEQNESTKALLKVTRFAHHFYRETLKRTPSTHPVWAYLKQRAMTSEFVERFELGLAPESWTGLVDYLKTQKISSHHAETIGLIRKKDSRCFDFFRNRLMFPIYSSRSHIIGFGAREIGTGPGPKYLNSADSPIYHKGRELFGLHHAKALIREKKRVYIVEGYLDCLRMIDAGFPAVAPLGTSLTSEQLHLLSRFGAEIYFIFDGDAAGLRALLRSTVLAFESGIMPWIVLLPEKEDPDSMIVTQGAQALQTLIDHAEKAADFLLNRLRSAPQLENLSSETTELLLKIKNPFDRVRYLEKLSAFIGIPTAELERHFRSKRASYSSVNPPRPSSEHETPRDVVPQIPPVLSQFEYALFHHLLTLTELSENHVSRLKDIQTHDGDLPRGERMLSPFSEHLLTWCLAEWPKRKNQSLLASFQDPTLFTPTPEKALLSAWLEKQPHDPLGEASLQNLIEKIALHQIKNKLRRLSFSIEQAEKLKNIEHMAELLDEKKRLMTLIKRTSQPL